MLSRTQKALIALSFFYFKQKTVVNLRDFFFGKKTREIQNPMICSPIKSLLQCVSLYSVSRNLFKKNLGANRWIFRIFCVFIGNFYAHAPHSRGISSKKSFSVFILLVDDSFKMHNLELDFLTRSNSSTLFSNKFYQKAF